MAKAVELDFTNVKEGGNFSKKRLAAGDYKARVTKWEKTKVKKGDNEGKTQWLFTIAVEGRHGATYPYYCQFAENQLWKIRNLLVAAGINVPKKRVKVDPERLVGKLIGITLDDVEYEGREQSEVTAVFPASEVDPTSTSDDDDDDEDDEDEDDEEPAPKKSKSKKSSKKDEDEDEDEDDEDEDEGSEDDDEDDEDEEEEKPKKKSKKGKSSKKSKKSSDDDDEDEDDDELDIDDL